MKSILQRVCTIFLCVFFFFITLVFNNKYYDKVCYATGESETPQFINVVVLEILKSVGVVGGSAGVLKTVLGNDIKDKIESDCKDMFSPEYLHETTKGITFDFEGYCQDHKEFGKDVADLLNKRMAKPLVVDDTIAPVEIATGVPYNLDYDWDFTAQGDDLVGFYNYKGSLDNVYNFDYYFKIYSTFFVPEEERLLVFHSFDGNFSFVRKYNKQFNSAELFYVNSNVYQTVCCDCKYLIFDHMKINYKSGQVTEIGDDSFSIPEKKESVSLEWGKAVSNQSISADSVQAYNSATYSNTFDKDLLAPDTSTTWEEGIGDLTGVNTRDWARDYTHDKTQDKTWDDAKDKVKEKTRDVAKENEKDNELDNDMTLPNSIGLDFNPLMESVGKKFPFCIPWDFVNLIRNLEKERKAPEWDIKWQPFNHSDGDNPEIGKFEYLLSFKQFDTIATILRYFLLVVFVYTLISKTNKYIGRG